MMTFKEIDERINHYEDELKGCYQVIIRLDKATLIEIDNSKKESIRIRKMKIEFFCFVTTSYIDLLCTYRNIKRAKSDWERNFSIKIAYLIAYETINTYHKYKGEIYKAVLKEEKDFYKNFFDMLNRELAEFKYDFDYDNLMPKIRNKSTAHYDKNFSEYYLSYGLIEKYGDKDIVRSFLYFINPLHYFTNALMNDEIDEFLFLNSWLS
ncbi:hypothetical protein [Paraflavitalea sp. CAU 1676]|uniref:hypothetical protein n=1 Tax=Paraflavitalea sp. CAU 1676 TaxID=3032598 RepID=UPI0023DB1C6C|nr:hypothetical protein [Paraflavitalea sp. CAU 1676]MDF2189834.1 hypothetical protein [Paraflavitalea sp. CAU 1676]